MTTVPVALVRVGWLGDSDLLADVRSRFEYAPGDDRATGYLWGDGVEWWPAARPMDRLESELGIVFTHVAFQAYRNGSGCDWHTDSSWDTQAILSLGATRTFGVRPTGGEPEWWPVSHGDLVFMPSGFQDTHEHCVPVNDEPGERISLVFRTARS